jgi:hypothetical protein
VTALCAKLYPVRRDLVLVGLVGSLAIVLTVLLATTSPATAGPLSLQSPVSPLIEPTTEADPPAQETSEPPVGPAVEVAETISPDQPAARSSKPPISVGVLAGLMVVVGIIALIITLSRG